MLKKLTVRDVSKEQKEFEERTAHLPCTCSTICKTTCNLTDIMVAEWALIMFAIWKLT